MSVRGRLAPGAVPSMMAQGRRVQLSGDDATMSILADERLAGADLEAIGHYAEPGKFRVNAHHTKALFVHRDGKRLLIGYWCSVCSIRTYTPGKCVCCQGETDLDPKEKFVD